MKCFSEAVKGRKVIHLSLPCNRLLSEVIAGRHTQYMPTARPSKFADTFKHPALCSGLRLPLYLAL